MPKNISKNLKESFQNHKGKHNVGIIMYHEKFTKNLRIFWLITKKFIILSMMNIKSYQKPNEYVQSKYSEIVLNSRNDFVLSLVISFMGS